MGFRIETYPDVGGGFRWRMVDGNNRIVAVSGEAYTRRADCGRAIENVVSEISKLKDEYESVDLRTIGGIDHDT